jgi:HlyD family secretion protein
MKVTRKKLRRPVLRWSVLRWSVLALATAAVLGTGTAYAVTGGDPAARYRTVAATTSDVEQTLSTTGLVDAAKRADLAFGTGGTLASLLVQVGDTVKAGEVIGKLDATDLDAALTQAKADLARAVAQLATDRASQASAVAGVQTPAASSTPTASATPSTPSGGSSGSAATAKLLKALKKAQDEVILAQSHASQAIAAAKQALAEQQAACAPDASTQDASTQDASTQAADPATDESATTCDTALAAVQQAQDVVSDAQDALAKALGTLGQVLGQALGSVQDAGQVAGQGSTLSRTSVSASSSSTPSTGSDSSGSGGTGSDSSGSGGTGSGGTVTAAQLASDQAKIEAANAAVVTARQNRAQATLRSTRGGSVVALDAAVGDTITAGSTVATVVGGNAVTITGSVTESQVDSVKVGQTVRVSVPGISRTTSGKVTAIGLVADSSSGTTSYPVTVTVEDPTISLPAGSRALVKIVLATAEDVVTVPTSAVTRRGTGTTATATVSTWDGATLSRRTVKLGAVGSRVVAITSGLKSGDRVVLANIDEAISGASSQINDRSNMPNFQFRGPAGGTGGPVTFSKAG